jgi:hypothetical protein
MYSIKQTTDGFSLRNERLGRDVLRLDSAGNHRLAGVPAPRMFDDFLGDVLADQWGVRKGSDGACADFAIAAAANGTIAATTGAGAGASMAANGVQLEQSLNWKPSQGNLVFEARVKLDAVTTVALFAGLTDQVAALEMPATLGGSDALTTNFSDGVGFLFDTAADTDDIWLVGVKADTDATKQDSGLAFAADSWRVLRIELDSAGNASFFIDGVQRGTAMANATTASVALTPVIAGFSRAAASRVVTVDYVLVQADRA